MTGCARCGDCCERINIPLTAEHVARLKDVQAPADADPETVRHAYSNRFISEHWHPIIEDGEQATKVFGGHHLWLYSCDQFDAEGRLCMAQDTKPIICQDYPWYGKDPVEYLGNDDHKPLGSRCSFWRDIPRELWPADADPLPDPDAAS